jgi:hypothetical protein
MRRIGRVWAKVRHWIDVPVIIFITVVYIKRWLPKFDGQQISAELWQVVIPLAKDSIMASMTATSIFFPTTIGIMAYLLGRADKDKNMRDSVKQLFHASVCFIFSLGFAIWIFTHLPIRVEMNLNIAYHHVLGPLAIVHFFLLAFGMWKLLRASFYLWRGIGGES